MKNETRLPRPGIMDAAYHLPGPPVDLLEWGPQHNVPADRMNKLIENRCRYFHEAHGASDADLVTEAGRAVLEKNRIDPRRIAFLIHAHTQPFSAPPAPDSILSRVRSNLGMKPQLEFSITHLACTSVVHAMQWASHLLNSFPDAEYALVTTADRVFGKVEHRLRQDACIQSDGGSAILIGREQVKAYFSKPSILRFNRLHEGPEADGNAALITHTCWRHTRDALKQVEEETGLHLSDFSSILPTNADWPFWKLTARGLGIDPERFYAENIYRHGHACSNDFAINLVDFGFAELSQNRPIIFFAQSNLGIQAALPLFASAALPGSSYAN